MGLPKTTYLVELNPQDDGDSTVVKATIFNVDRLKAERALKPMGGMDTDLALTLNTAWIWAALTRTGDYTGPLARFLEVDCLDFDEDEETEGQTVDPTQPAVPTESP